MKTGYKRLFLIAVGVLVLLLASCQSASTEQETETDTQTQTTPMTTDALGKTVEAPQYGGTITLAIPYVPVLLDDGLGIVYLGPAIHTGECLDEGNWVKGPTGSNEISWRYNAMPPMDLMGGGLAESWELVGTDEMIFHIRENVYFHNKPPANGRQMDAYDVVFSINRGLDTPTAYIHNAIPRDIYIESVEALDKWTVSVKCKPGKHGVAYQRIAGMTRIIPHEVIDEYGGISDWTNLTGTGPFILTDYVYGTSATLERNSNYWQNDPLHPSNKLPYVDTLNQVYITDTSTRLSAIRTGKADWISGVSWEDAERLMQDVPNIEHVEYPASSAAAIHWRVDKPEVPTYDTTVRHALSMAIDRDAIANEYYGGHAEKLMWPVMPDPAFSSIYTPFDKLPEEISEILSYNPDKAKQLLAEAGFPDGFEISLVCQQGDVDYLTLVKGYWEQVGVELTLDVKEAAVWTSIGAQKSHESMFYYSADAAVDWDKFTRLATGMPLNYAMISDPIIDQAALDVAAAGTDAVRKMETFKPMVNYLLQKSYMLVLPAQNSFVMWQPWVKSYSGETMIGHIYTMWNFPKYVWTDVNLKESLTK
jgi:peptide/nickel transport system substrate-binding protein